MPRQPLRRSRPSPRRPDPVRPGRNRSPDRHPGLPLVVGASILALHSADPARLRFDSVWLVPGALLVVGPAPSSSPNPARSLAVVGARHASPASPSPSSPSTAQPVARLPSNRPAHRLPPNTRCFNPRQHRNVRAPAVHRHRSDGIRVAPPPDCRETGSRSIRHPLDFDLLDLQNPRPFRNLRPEVDRGNGTRPADGPLGPLLAKSHRSAASPPGVGISDPADPGRRNGGSRTRNKTSGECPGT